MPYILAAALGGVEIPYTAITIVFIILATAVGAFVRKRSRDKCLRDFERNMVTLEERNPHSIGDE